MQITAKTWNEYITRLSRLNQKAGQLMRQYIDTHGTGDADALITYAAALVTKYGEGSAELACQMYDALAEAANAGVPAAEPAVPADYGEVARMVNATKNQNPANLPNGVSRLVKRAGIRLRSASSFCVLSCRAPNTETISKQTTNAAFAMPLARGSCAKPRENAAAARVGISARKKLPATNSMLQ